MSATLQTVTANFRGKVREEILHGKTYVVAPVTMIKEGVLKGSTGAIMYTNAAVNKDIQRWNSMPLVLNHPENSNGDKISARTPAVLEKYGIGFVFNTSYDVSKKSLKAEAWFDKAKISEVAPKILADIEKHKPVELSTGLFTKTLSSNGEFNGKKFTHSLSAYEPDHLAILTDEEGACSVKDGCGVNTNASSEKKCGCSHDLSHEEIRQALLSLVTPEVVTPSTHRYMYISKVYNDRFIFTDDLKHFQQSYKTTEGKVSLSGEPVEVVSKTEYKPVKRNASSFEFQTNSSGKSIPKPLVVNCAGDKKCGTCSAKAKKKKKTKSGRSFADLIDLP